MNHAPPLTPLPPGAICAYHPEREAARACARCGTFVCGGCLVGGDLCEDCKRRLLREGTPWSPAEKARADARRRIRQAERLLRVELILGATAAVVLVAVTTGAAPSLLRPVGTALWAAAATAGLGVAVAAGLSWRGSERGRPGPAVAGVVSFGEALLLGGLGILPAVLSVAPLLAALRSAAA